MYTECNEIDVAMLVPCCAFFTRNPSGITFFKCPMYVWHFSMVTVSQNAVIPEMNSPLDVRFTSLLITSFNSCQRFSIGFRSGDFGDVVHQLMPS